jgi:hypothetical protein
LSSAGLGIESNLELLDKAREIARNLPQELRSSVYDTAFGGALIDEPKPFLDIPRGDARFEPQAPPGQFIDTCDPEILKDWDEVARDEREERIIYINYSKYNHRDARFNCEYRKFKQGKPPYLNLGSWYNQGSFAYFFNKEQKSAELHPGIIRVPFLPGVTEKAVENQDYNAYLAASVSGFPTEVRVRSQFMLLFFFYCNPHPKCWWPGFIYHPFAWISSVDFGSRNFSLSLRKRTKFSRSLFFNQPIELEHTSTANIRGNIWSGYDFSLQ